MNINDVQRSQFLSLNSLGDTKLFRDDNLFACRQETILKNFCFWQLVANLTSKDFADQIRKRIWDNQTHSTDWYGPVWEGRVKTGTAHLSVVAQNGDAVSVTSTINSRWAILVPVHLKSSWVPLYMIEWMWKRWKRYLFTKKYILEYGVNTYEMNEYLYCMSWLNIGTAMIHSLWWALSDKVQQVWHLCC